MNKKIIIVVMVICLLSLIAVFAFSQSSPNVRWEYTRVMFGSNFWDTANARGNEGWEMFATTNQEALFKRRLP